MRIECPTLQEFFDCVRSEEKFFQNAIRYSVVRRPVGKDPTIQIKEEVILQVTTVVVADPGEYLLQSAEHCGYDYNENPPERNGSEKAEELVKNLQQFAKVNRLKLLPGIIHE